MEVRRLGLPRPVKRLTNGLYRFEMPLDRVPDPAWVRVLEGRLGGAVSVAGDLVVFEARGAEVPGWVARLDAGLRAANDRRRERSPARTAGERVA